jgi:hypothetical protein
MPGAAVMGPRRCNRGWYSSNSGHQCATTYKSNSANQASALADKISEVLQKFFQKQGWIK